MITVEIPRKELLRQLPQMAGYALLQWLDEMPDKFVFEAAAVKSRSEELAELYPTAFEVLTLMEWELFRALWRRGKVTHSTLYYGLHIDTEDRSLARASNVLSVHIKNLRYKIKEHQLPFRVLTFDAKHHGQGSYKLIEIS